MISGTGEDGIFSGYQNLWLRLLAFYRAIKTFCQKSYKLWDTNLAVILEVTKKAKAEPKPGNINKYFIFLHYYIFYR